MFQWTRWFGVFKWTSWFRVDWDVSMDWVIFLGGGYFNGLGGLGCVNEL